MKVQVFARLIPCHSLFSRTLLLHRARPNTLPLFIPLIASLFALRPPPHHLVSWHPRRRGESERNYGKNDPHLGPMHENI